MYPHPRCRESGNCDGIVACAAIDIFDGDEIVQPTGDVEDIVAAGTKPGVIARAAIDGIQSFTTAGNREAIVSSIAKQKIISGQASDGIDAFSTPQCIANSITGDRVVAGTAVHHDAIQGRAGEIQGIVVDISQHGHARFTVGADGFDAVAGAEITRELDKGFIALRLDGVIVGTAVVDIAAFSAAGNQESVIQVATGKRIVASSTADRNTNNTRS